MLLITAPCYVISLMIAMYEGVVAYAFYQTKKCDPFESNQLTNPNQARATVLRILRTVVTSDSECFDLRRRSGKKKLVACWSHGFFKTPTLTQQSETVLRLRLVCVPNKMFFLLVFGYIL